MSLQIYPKSALKLNQHKGQDAGYVPDGTHPGFRPLDRFAPVAVNSGLRPETRWAILIFLSHSLSKPLAGSL